MNVPIYCALAEECRHPQNNCFLLGWSLKPMAALVQLRRPHLYVATECVNCLRVTCVLYICACTQSLLPEEK